MNRSQLEQLSNREQEKARQREEDRADAELFRWLCKQRIVQIYSSDRIIDVNGYDLRDALIKAKFEGEEE